MTWAQLSAGWDTKVDKFAYSILYGSLGPCLPCFDLSDHHVYSGGSYTRYLDKGFGEEGIKESDRIHLALLFLGLLPI